MKNLSETTGRLYYLDWIRVFAMVGIFFFHNARFFDAFNDWHVKNASTNIAASSLIAFMSQWIMPLFFLIAGAGVYYALKSRRPGQFIQERCLRLLIPLVFGMLVIVVPQAYFQAVSHGEQLGGYNLFQIYWLYLQTIPDLNWFHLWFLVDLFIHKNSKFVLYFVNWPVFYAAFITNIRMKEDEVCLEAEISALLKSAQVIRMKKKIGVYFIFNGIIKPG